MAALVAPSSSNGGLLSSPGGGRGLQGARAAMLGGLPSTSMDVDGDGDGNGARRVNGHNGVNGNGGAARVRGANGNRADEAIDEDEAAEGGAGGNRRRARPKRYRDAEDIPRVKDETGERVREQFELFLTKWVKAMQDWLLQHLWLT